MQNLGKTANDAVFATAVRGEDLDSDDDTEAQIDEENDEGDDLDEGQTDTEINENFVNNLNENKLVAEISASVACPTLMKSTKPDIN